MGVEFLHLRELLSWGREGNWLEHFQAQKAAVLRVMESSNLISGPLVDRGDARTLFAHREREIWPLPPLHSPARASLVQLERI